MGDFKDLIVYKKAFKLAMKIFNITKNFPKEEIFSLTLQIRKSSRSVCSNISESYRKRQYPNHFVAKVSDADMENSETQVWIDFAFECGYINKDMEKSLLKEASEIGCLLNDMIEYPEKYKSKNVKRNNRTL